MRGQVVPFGDLRGGLNTRDSAYQIRPNQARDLLNVSGSVAGAIRKRDGYTSFATPTNPLASAIGVEALATKAIFGADPTLGDFMSVSDGGVVTNRGGTPGTAPWSFIQAPANTAQGPVFGMNGVDAPIFWDGGLAVGAWTASSGTMPNGKFLIAMANRVWIAGMTTYAPAVDPKSTMVFSDIGNPRAYPAANYVQFDPNDGDEIMGLGSIGPYLLVFKRRKVFLVYDLNTGANRRLSDNVGCVSHRSIVETSRGTFFLSDRGVFISNGQNIELLSDIVTPTIQSIFPANYALASGAFFNNHYYLAFSTGGTANTNILDFDLELQSWWLHSGAFHQLIPWRPVNEALLYGTDASVGRISRLFVPSTPTDYGAAMKSFWTGAWLAPNGPVTRKRLRQVRADIAGHVQLNLARDFAGTPSLAKVFNFLGNQTTFGDTGNFGGVGDFGDAPVVKQGIAPSPSPGVGRSFSLQWYSEHQDAWRVEAFELLVSDRRN